MDLKPYLAFLIQVLTAISAQTSTTIDDAFLGLLKALQDSPQLLDWLGKLFTRQQGVPTGAMPEIDPSNHELAAAFNASPAVKEWSLAQSHATSPPGSEQLAIGSVLTLIKFLPTLLSLLKAAKDSGVFNKTK